MLSNSHPSSFSSETLKSSLKSAHLKPTAFRGRQFREAVNDALRDVVRVGALAFVLALALDLDDLRVASDAEARVGRRVAPEILAQTLSSARIELEQPLGMRRHTSWTCLMDMYNSGCVSILSVTFR